MIAVKRITEGWKKYNLLLIFVICFSVFGVFFLLKSHAAANIVWPFSTKSEGQYHRIDQGWDIQAGAGAHIYAISSGTLHVYQPDPGGFGNDYPVEQLDQSIGGPTNWVYYGHVHILPGLKGQHVSAGQLIATANNYSGQNGSVAPPGWLEIGFAQPGTDAPADRGSESVATAAGTTMHNILIQSSVQPVGSVPPPPPPPSLAGGAFYYPACASTSNLGSVLYQNTNLTAGRYIQSPNAQYRLCNDNGFVSEWHLLNGSYYDFKWSAWASTGVTIVPSNYLTILTDGNLAYKYGVNNAYASPISQTNGWWDNKALPDTLTIANNGNLILRNAKGQAVWSSYKGRTNQKAHTASDGETFNQCQGSTLDGSSNQYLTNDTCLISPDGTYMLSFTGDGHLQEVDGFNNLVWNPNIAAPGGSFKIQQDGNLVLYSSTGGVIWSSHTENSGSSDTLTLQDDGNLVVNTSVGQTVWSWETGKIYPTPINIGTTLGTNQSLYPNEEIVASNGYRLRLQLDGNLVIYNPYGSALCYAVMPCTFQNSKPSRLTMQPDGNLVLYNYANSVIWQSHTYGMGTTNNLVMQPDGNLVIYSPDHGNIPIWATSRGGLINYSTLFINQSLYPNQSLYSSDWSHQLILQPDGNLVLYNNSGGGHQYIWQSNTYGRSAGHLIMQPDGNLVLYDASGAYDWQSNTYGSGSNNYLVVQPDGNMVVYKGAGGWAWQSYTYGR
ncbi:MAG TPA: bulb-type lectin domain-containing protein [Candidatus Saccharimonadales bacterium]|nr:bulb-type lectin domain-containing protein [Candidatus Saccharimonadales bacterium]